MAMMGYPKNYSHFLNDSVFHETLIFAHVQINGIDT